MYWFVYILRCSDNSLYTGITPTIHKRINSHNLGKGSRYVAAHLPAKLVYFEKHENRSLASKREYKIKRWQKIKKEKLVKPR